MRRPLARGLVAAATLAAAASMVAEAITGAPAFGIVFNLLLVITAAGLWLYAGGGRLVAAGTLAGILACLMWAAAFAFGWWQTEAAYIAISALWWLAVGQCLWRSGRRWYGGLTLALGVAALIDAVATGSGSSFALAGVKLPLQLLWTAVTAAVMLYAAGAGQDGRPGPRENVGGEVAR